MPRYAPIPSLLAMAAVHNRLVREKTRTQVALIIESGEPREVMHFALLIGYGASAINPYLAYRDAARLEAARADAATTSPADYAEKNFIKAINKGLLKTFSKMGISTLQSYRGAQVFEAVGLNKSLVDTYFAGTASRIEGVGLDVLAREAQMKHAYAFQPLTESETELVVGGAVPVPRRRRVPPAESGRPSASCSTRCATTTPTPSRSTPTWSTTRASICARCAA